MNNVEELIANVKKDDMVTAKITFDSLIASKINTAMNAKKVELGSTMINRVASKQVD